MKHNNLIEEITEEKLFRRECKLINLKYEYLGYTGNEEWAIVSELSKDELMQKYPEQLVPYIPFIHFSEQQGETIREYNRNEDKHKKRSQNNEYGFEEVTEYAHPELIQPNFIEVREEAAANIERAYSKMQLLEEAMDSLTEKQKKYLTCRFIQGRSARDIAAENGITHQAVEKNINAAIKKFEKIFGDFFRK